jgi:hypothetical protein
MADIIYKVRAPDGSILKIQGPEGASEADLQQAAEQHFASLKNPTTAAPVAVPPPPAAAAPAPVPSAPEKPQTPYSNPETVYDPVSGAPMDYGFGSDVGKNMMSFGIGALKPVAGALQYANIQEPAKFLNKAAEDFANTSGTGPLFDIAGQVLSPVPGAIFKNVGKAMSYAPKVPGALQAAGQAAGQFVDKSPLIKGALEGLKGASFVPTDTQSGNYSDFLKDKFVQDLEGLGVGAGLSKLGQMATNPQVSESMKKLKDMGMKAFTPGQLMSDIPIVGPGIRKAEQALTSLPLAGSVITNATENVYRDFNRSLANNVLKPLGDKVPKDIPAGNQMIDYVRTAINDSYEGVVQNAHFIDHFDPQTRTTTVERLWNGVLDKISPLVPKQAEIAGKDITDNIINHIDNTKVMTGAQFRNMEKYLGERANTFYEKGATDLGNAYQKVQDMLRKELEVQNPAIARELSLAHEAFKRFIPIEKAAAMRGADKGMFSPQQFKGQAEASAGKAATASGTGLSIPEAQAGVDVMGKQMPSSGTSERLFTTKGVLEGGANLLTYGVPLITTALGYSMPAMKGMTALATSRPDWMKKLAPQVQSGLGQLGGVMAARPTGNAGRGNVNPPLQ